MKNLDQSKVDIIISIIYITNNVKTKQSLYEFWTNERDRLNKIEEEWLTPQT